ncbi:MAG: type II toxin-antitoxin system RelB/DinJ family antitoxin [Peptoniphilus grossensis]|uniref:type II toxin-antitoxin system RelB/DinJ family antitoxin n=1 Tax=Peptoniphilus grossensis TaxID=1465756 RepID=UPI002590E3DC|nr:type II toxin-antitoxin system RelB/DinJ family antitoxin [Peptoniphilus grossensis]MDU5100264.1 type II toxin-antitoxin system RelB/DinJ family antitoxin [Peptoniphilus grossensis]
MSTTNLNIRTDKKVKEDAEKIFAELGLNMTSAINIFLRASIRESGIPFALKLDVPNEETSLAIEEAKRIATDDGVEAFDNMDDLRKALDI